RRAASEHGLTRWNLPFLLGTAITTDRSRAKVVGYGVHFAFGLLFAIVYWLLFLALGRGGPVVGAIFGVGHGLFAGTVVVNSILPAVHPRMGTPFSAAPSTPLLEPPGFLMLNYGVGTPI